MASASTAKTLLGGFIGYGPDDPYWFSNLSSFTSAMGQAPAIVDTFIDATSWGSAMDGQAQWSANEIEGLGYIPTVAIPMATSADTSADAAFKAIIAGDHDADFESIFQSYANDGFKTFYIRPGWEFDGTWWPWSVDSSNEADFVAAFQHIAALAHSFSGATIKVIWEPNGGSPYSPSMYPGNAAVDIVGIDQFGYGASGTADSQVFESDGSTWSFTTAAQVAVANGKPLSADEVTDTPADTPQYAADVAQALTSVPGLVVDHITLVNDPSQQLWATNAAAATAWQQAFAEISAYSNANSGSGGAAAAESPNGTTVTTAGPSIVDASGNTWTLVQSTNSALGLQIAVNGVVDPITQNVVVLEMLNGAIVQENNSNNWYTESAPGAGWTQIADPTSGNGGGTTTTTTGSTSSSGSTTGGGTTTPSPSGTTITSASGAPIIDAAGNSWTLVQSATASLGLQIAVNGVVDPITQNVVMLETLNGQIVQENTSNNWYTESAPGAGWTQIADPNPTQPTPSPNGTTITSASGAPIIDAAGNSWTLVQSATASLGLQIAVNGVVDPITQNVVLLETLNGQIVQENTSNNWYEEATPGAAWTQIADPVADTPQVTAPASETVTAGSKITVTGVSVTDPWAAQQAGNVTLTVTDADGTLTVGGNTVAAGTTGTLTGTLAQINTDLAGMTYAAAGAGSDTITVDVVNQAGNADKVEIPVTISPETISIAANQSSTTVNQSYATLSATSGSHKVFLYGSHDSIQMSGGTETIQESGADNTFVLPKVGSGYDVLSGSELTNGDTFDFRTALAATKWDGQSGDLAKYLHVATSSAGNTTVSISTTSGGSATHVLVLDGVKESMSQILAHSLT